jgi:hypothetical protein
MKIRKQYVVILYDIRKVVELTKPSIRVDNIQLMATIGVRIFDCNFNQAKKNIRLATKQNYYLIKNK